MKRCRAHYFLLRILAPGCRAGDINDVPRATVGCLVSSTMGSVVATPRVVVQRQVLWMLWSCACKKRKPFAGHDRTTTVPASPPCFDKHPLFKNNTDADAYYNDNDEDVEPPNDDEF